MRLCPSGAVVVALLASGLLAGVAMASEPVVVKVHPDVLVERPASPLVAGNFLELGFGRQVEGLWAEKFFNRSFEPVSPYKGITWFWLRRAPGAELHKEVWWHSGYEEAGWYLPPGNAEAEWRLLEHGGICHGLQAGWLINNSAKAPALLAQDRIHVKRGEKLVFSGALRAAREMFDLGPSDKAFDVDVVVYKDRDFASELARVSIGGIHSAFAHHTATLDLGEYEGFVTFAITCPPKAVLNVDDFSLMPATTYEGWRPEAIAALKQVGVPILRWPGGCFASFYHWREGIGPRALRVPRQSEFWGGLNDNDVGTPEFIELCALIDAEPFICVNMITGTPAEAAEWVAYCNTPASHPIGALRAADGHEQPWGVTMWELDNETYRRWGPKEYAQACVEYSRAMKAVDPTIKTTMVAYANFLPHLDEMLAIAGRDIDFVTDRSIDETTLRRDLDIIRAYNAAKGTTIQLCNTEWLAQVTDVPVQPDWQNLQPLPEDDTLQNRQIRWQYALNCARQLMLFRKLGGDFHFANFNNLANTWGQNVVECPKEGVYISAVGRVFETLGPSPAAWPLRVDHGDLPASDVAVAWDLDRKRLVVDVINGSASERVVTLNTEALGRPFKTARLTTVVGDSPSSFNSLTSPDAIRHQASTVAVEQGGTWTLPPFSLTHVVLE